MCILKERYSKKKQTKNRRGGEKNDTQRTREKNIMTNKKRTCTVVEGKRKRNFTSYDKML